MQLGKWFAVLIAVAWIFHPSVTASAQTRAFDSDVATGNSSSKAKKNAQTLIPFQQLTQTASDKLKPVVSRPSIFRRMPVMELDCDEEMFVFLVRYPEVLVNIWDLMGVTKVTVQRSGAFNFAANDGAGTTCKGELIYGSGQLHVYYGDGNYEGPMVARELKGKSVCVLHSRPVVDEYGNRRVRGFMDVFIKLDNLGVDLLARTIAPFVTKTADNNFIETAKFVSQLSKIAEANPRAIENISTRLSQVDASVRDEFVKVAYRVAQRSSQRQLGVKKASQSPTEPSSQTSQTQRQFVSRSSIDNGSDSARMTRSINDSRNTSSPARNRTSNRLRRLR